MQSHLQLPKYVEINNPRLVIFNYVMKMTLFLVYACSFYFSRGWQYETDFTDKLFVNIGGEPPPNASAVYLDKHANSPLCRGGDGYDYSSEKYPEGTTGDYEYKNITCNFMCDGDRAGRECINSADLYSATSTELFINTHVSDRFYSATVHATSSRNELFFPLADEMIITVKYGFTAVGKDNVGESAWNIYTQLVRCESADSCDESLSDTFALDGTPLPPSRSGQIELPVEKLLQMAGMSKDDLLKANPRAGPNYLPSPPNDYIDGPAVMLAGMELIIELECFDWPKYGGEYPDSIPADIAGEVKDERYKTPYMCYLWAKSGPRPWVSYDRLDTVDIHGSMRHRRYFGISVSTRVSGKFTGVYISGILQWIIMGYVLLSFPTEVISWVTRNLLGRLSTIYTKAVIEQFSLRTGIGSCCTHLVANYVMFTELQDGKGIPKRRVGERLKEVLDRSKHSETIDEKELAALTDFCVSAIAFGTKGSQNEDEDDEKPAGEEEYLTAEQYDNSMAMNEKVHFDDVVNLFDVQRTRSFMERVFTPAYLSEAVNKFTDLHAEGKAVRDLKGAGSAGLNGHCELTQKAKTIRARIGHKLHGLKNSRRMMTLAERKEDVHETHACVDYILHEHHEIQNKMEDFKQQQEHKEQKAKDYASSLATKTLLACMEECHNLRGDIDNLKHKQDMLAAAVERGLDNEVELSASRPGGGQSSPNAFGMTNTAPQPSRDYHRGFQDGVQSQILIRGSQPCSEKSVGVASMY